MSPSETLVLLVGTLLLVLILLIGAYLLGRHDGRTDERRSLGIDVDLDENRPAAVAARVQPAQTAQAVQTPARMTAAPAAPPPPIGPKTPDH